MIGTKLLIKSKSLTKIKKTWPKNSSEAVINEAENIKLGREIPKERYIAPDDRQKTIDDLRPT